MEVRCITCPFQLDGLWRSAGTMEHMFANRRDRSVGGFPAACGKFVRQSPGGGKRGGKDAAVGSDRPIPCQTRGGGFLTITFVAAVRQLSRSLDSLTTCVPSAHA